MLYFLVGPSGVGKDSVLEEVRQRQTNDQRSLMVADRYITRKTSEVDDNHIALSEVEFKQKKDAHHFLFDWQSHGFYYGIDRNVLDYINDGHKVIVNGSRAYIEQAKNAFPELKIIWLSVPQDVLRERLFSRARESEREIEARLIRALEIEKRKPKDCKTIINDGEIENTVLQVLHWIEANS